MEEQREETYKEFDRRLRRLDEMSEYLRVHPFTKVYTQRDIFRHLQKMRTKEGKGRYKYDEMTFMKVIKKLNTRLKEMILDGLLIYLPSGLGSLFIEERTVKLLKLKHKDGTSYFAPSSRIDWNTTKKMWYEDKEMRDSGHVVWCNIKGDKDYRIKYSREGLNSITKNIIYYKFRPMRSFKRELKDIEKSKVIFKYDKVYKYKTGNGRRIGFTSIEES